jgi:hypothetical protein
MRISFEISFSFTSFIIWELPLVTENPRFSNYTGVELLVQNHNFSNNFILIVPNIMII